MALCKALVDTPHGDGEQSLHAYILLDCWKDNPLAEALETEYPTLAAQRCPVPDDLYMGREDEAPCLVPAPDLLWPAQNDPGLQQLLAQEAFAHWLHAARGEAQGRLVRQHFGGLLFSRAALRVTAQHLGRLGLQYPPVPHALPGDEPTRGPARLFRYHDPRVMQRVWHALTPQQQTWWMGPVRDWWSLRQPWEPWTLLSDDPATADDLQAERAQWFRAKFPDIEATAHTSHQATSRLFDPRQWALAHLAPVAQRTWARYLRRDTEAKFQPDGDSMTRLLNEGLRHGLIDADLDDFVWCSWRIEPATPHQPARADAIDWQDAGWSALLQRVLGALRAEPDAGFASLFDEHKNNR